LSFPAIAEEDETHIIESPWGKRTFQRKAGEVLQPERESKFTLDIIRKNTGEYDFASQYQQSPMPLGGAIIKTQWFRYYDLGKLPERFTSVLQSCSGTFFVQFLRLRAGYSLCQKVITGMRRCFLLQPHFLARFSPALLRWRAPTGEPSWDIRMHLTVNPATSKI
jgi:hypothetical protein